MELPPLPQEFSALARRNIIAAKIKAEQALVNRRKPLRSPDPWGFEKRSWETIKCVMAIFAAFGHEACEMAKSGWAHDRIERDAQEFLRQLIVEARRRYAGSEFQLPVMLSSIITLLPESERVLYGTREWKRFQNELLKAGTLGVATESQIDHVDKFHKRALWLKERLRERAWDHHDPWRHSGPDRKTIDKILLGRRVREDVLGRLALALSQKHGKVVPSDIPTD